MISIPIQTPAGAFMARFSASGLAQLDFPNARTAIASANGAVRGAVPRRWVAQTRTALEEMLRGRPPRALPPLDDSAGTDFQRSVWAALRRIPQGRTLSYSEVAAQIGRPGAARAVGGACGANPLPVLVPCHRVLAANRRLGGFSGGLDWKRRLLACEGVRV